MARIRSRSSGVVRRTPASRHADIDAMLDTVPHTGGVTTLEAMVMGVPTITLLGERVAGRLSGSISTTDGLPALVATSPDEYVEIAVRLAADRERLVRERATLRDRLLASPIGDTRAYTRAVEDAYRTLWQRWCGEWSAVSNQPSGARATGALAREAAW
jgi:predicted O-linked N-acetylglucosamine transferase (SPINDLY family)